MGTFYEYYAGIKKAPYLTIFVGGNHEASNFLREMFINEKKNIYNLLNRYFGGWVAEKIYFLGSSGTINIKKGNLNLRLSGISGIYKDHDFANKSIEKFPLKNNISCYHTKQIDVMKLSLI